ncbi:hypothetical protein F5Y12DRAFT_721013 [Xylaria sp. FL1777]|nr:hypothetical protein F5Y12DRAFT_721013 [Xylaria sp. FL1777]
MSSSLGNRHASKGSVLAIAALALLTLADNILTNTLPFTLGPRPPQIPGFWNLTTTALIISVVSVYWGTYARTWTSAIAPVFKIIGGGSHATTFLTITTIWEKTSGSLRAALIYTTGAVVVLCQTVASSVTPFLVRQHLALPYIFSIAFCILAGFVTLIDNTPEAPTSGQEWASDSSVQPLLPPRTASEDAASASSSGFIAAYSIRWRNNPSMTRKPLKLLGWVFLLAAIAKATRPLFITYIQHRVGITPLAAS